LNATVVRTIAVSGQNLFAGTMESGVFRSTDNGTSWTVINNGLNHKLIYSLAASGSNIFVGIPTGLFVSTNSGESWNPTNIVGPVLSIIVNASNILASSNNSIWRSTNNGLSWEKLSTSYGGYSIATYGTNIFVGSSGYVHRSTDNGTTWSSIKIGEPYLTLKVTALAIIDTILFAGFEGAGVYRSTDSGLNWTKVNNGLTKEFVQSLVAYGNNLFAGTYQGYVFLSTNNGTNWSYVGHGLANGSRNYIYSLAISGNNIFAGIMVSGVWRRPLSEMITSVERTSSEIPTSFNLSQNYPNPFNPSTTISFSIPTSEFVTLKVYDVLGRELATLVNENLSAGNYSYNFDASNLTSGVYLYKLQAGKYSETKKMILSK